MLTSSPLVSIAMATFNGEKYIVEQLESILNQTYKNIEIVITDDASSDNTIAMITDYQNKYACIKIFKNTLNIGINKTFENSIKNCLGEFIALSDQDDIWELNKLDILLKEIKNEDAVYSNSLLVDENGKTLSKLFSSLMNLQSYYSGVPFLMGNCVPGHAIMAKADFMKKIMPLPQKIMFDRWIGFCAASNNGLKYVDKGLVNYRQHENNVIGTRKNNKSKRKSKKQLFENKLAELTILKTAPITNNETKLLLTQMLIHFNRNPSFKRSFFFFKNINSLLVIKNKPQYRKILYCGKMFFKANY